MFKWAEEHGQLRLVIENSQAKTEDDGQKIQEEALVEAALDLEIRGLQAGDGRRGSDASQSIWCCFDAAIFQQFLAMGTEQAMQQISAMYREFSKSFEAQHQTAPITPVHVSQRKIENEGGEERGRSKKSRRVV